MAWNLRQNLEHTIECSRSRTSAVGAAAAVRPVRGLCCWIAVLALGVLGGCAEGREAAITTEVLTGKVTLKGKPLPEGRINFVSQDGVGSGGNLRPDGTYSLDGKLPVGKYEVFMTFDIPPAKIGTAAENVMKSVPEKYLSKTTSGLTADLEEGISEQNFDLQ